MKKVLFLLFSVTLFWSCQSIDLLSIDYLMPAEMSFPNQLRKVAVVNNMSASAPPTLVSQFVDKPDVNSRLLYQKTQYFSGDGKTTTEALAQALADGDYFDTVIICDSALRASNNEETPRALTLDEVYNLTTQLDADFLISVENIEMRVESKATPDPYFGLFVANTDVKVAPTIRIYLPQQSPRTPISKVDSIFWQGFGDDINGAVHDLPNQQTILREASTYAGEFIAKTFVPYWQSANRYYFTNGSVAMRDAVISVKEDKWEEAVNLWQKTFDSSKSTKKKMYAAFNLALGHEMLEQMDEAIDWATKSQQYATQASQAEVAQLASVYLQQLRDRKQSYASVKMQLQRFEEDF